MHCAFVYELIDWKPRRIDKILSFPGKFFLQPLSLSTGFCELGQTDVFSGQILQFFRGVEASVRTFAIVRCEGETPPKEDQSRSFLASKVGNTRVELCSRVIWVRGELQEQVARVSEFLRDSQSLLPADFSEIGKLRVIADAKGLAVVDTTISSLPVLDRFSRACQLVALSSAYGAVLDHLMNNLSIVGLSSGKAAEVALRDWSRFMSAYYFSEPIKQDTIELCRLYTAVKERQKLSVLAQEATEQLRLLAEIVRLDRTEAQAGRERRVQLLLGLLSLLLTFVGLSQVVQVTPKTVLEFQESWGSCSREFGWKDCATGNRPPANATNGVKPKDKRTLTSPLTPSR
jgi:hypothetical protein